MAGLLPSGVFHLESVYCAISYPNTWQNITWDHNALSRHPYGAGRVQNAVTFASESKEYGRLVILSQREKDGHSLMEDVDPLNWRVELL